MSDIVFSFGIAHSNLFLESRKDPGIPKLYPFKEEVLKQLEERKQRVG